MFNFFKSQSQDKNSTLEKLKKGYILVIGLPGPPEAYVEKINILKRVTTQNLTISLELLQTFSKKDYMVVMKENKVSKDLANIFEGEKVTYEYMDDNNKKQESVQFLGTVMFIPIIEKNKKDEMIKQDFLNNEMDNFNMKGVRIMSITDLKNNKSLNECLRISFKEEKEMTYQHSKKN
jgi:hypothetical protein